MAGCFIFTRDHICKGLLCSVQIQQLSWHKYDFILILIIAAVLLGYSISVLVGTARGHHSSIFLVILCSAYVAFALYTAARYGIHLAFATTSVQTLHL